MHVTIHYDQENAPTPEDAARATFIDLAKITVGSSLIIEVDDGEDTHLFEVSATEVRSFTAPCVLTDENIGTEDDCTTHDHDMPNLPEGWFFEAPEGWDGTEPLT